MTINQREINKLTTVFFIYSNQLRKHNSFNNNYIVITSRDKRKIILFQLGNVCSIEFQVCVRTVNFILIITNF